MVLNLVPFLFVTVGFVCLTAVMILSVIISLNKGAMFIPKLVLGRRILGIILLVDLLGILVIIT